MQMMTLEVPVISILIGEGGSGGALALAVADEVWMLENSVYSVISPEGCASILWKDSKKIKEASECLKLTADDLLQLGVIETIIRESGKDFLKTYQKLNQRLWATLTMNRQLSPKELVAKRYGRFRKFGEIFE